MYQLIPTKRFKKDLKKIKLQKNDFELVSGTLKQLQLKGVKGIGIEINPHKLKGSYADNWEYHIKPDLLIIWIQIENPKDIKLVRAGSHSELFR